MLANKSLKSLLPAPLLEGIAVSRSKLVNNWRPHACRDLIFESENFPIVRLFFVDSQERNFRVETWKSVREVLNELFAPIIVVRNSEVEFHIWYSYKRNCGRRIIFYLHVLRSLSHTSLRPRKGNFQSLSPRTHRKRNIPAFLFRFQPLNAKTKFLVIFSFKSLVKGLKDRLRYNNFPFSAVISIIEDTVCPYTTALRSNKTTLPYSTNRIPKY